MSVGAGESSDWSEMVMLALQDPDPARRNEAWGEFYNLLQWLVRSQMPPWLRRDRESGTITQSLVEDFLRNDLERLVRNSANEVELRGFVRTAVQNKVRMTIRRARAHKRKPNAPVHSIATSDRGSAAVRDRRTGKGEASPESAAIHSEEGGRLKRWLSRLSADKRQILRMRYWLGLSSREIGSRIGKKDTAVRKAEARLRDEARRDLDRTSAGS
ncbi:MAG: RNA polymerase sigma factor [Planctomycetota bacterium]|jgi:RNA polymerase sigma factor (sigma-70 family)